MNVLMSWQGAFGFEKRKTDTIPKVAIFRDTQFSDFLLRPVYTGDFYRATQCNFCRGEVATSCNFIASLVQFVSANVSTRLFLKQKLYAAKK